MKTYTQAFTAALFITAKKCKGSKCLPTSEPINKMLYIKKNILLS